MVGNRLIQKQLNILQRLQMLLKVLNLIWRRGPLYVEMLWKRLEGKK